MTTPISMKYADATDRAYGLCGMALALFVYDSEQYIASLCLDAPADRGIYLTPDFYVISNPRISAKTVWKYDYRQFQLSSAMVIGNLMSRALVRRRSEITRQVSDLMISALLKEGEEACGLEPDEVRDMLAEPYSYLRRIFMHPRVNSAITSMATELAESHTLDRDRVMAYLLPLNRL